MTSPTTNYSDIWASLERAAAEPSAFLRDKVVRELDGQGSRAFLGLELPDLQRQLLVDFTGADTPNIAEFPRWFGLEVKTLQLDVADIHGGQFLVLGERGRGPTAVYAGLMEDVWNHVSALSSAAEKLVGVRARLERWGDFFERTGPRGLTPPAQRGLFGELWFLREHLVPVLGVTAAVDAWVGQRRAHQDFQLPDAAIEMKTSIAKQLVEIRIASERQLDDRGIPPLFLAVLLLTELEAGGETLPNVVASVRYASEGTGSLVSLEEKLLDAGYVDEQATAYSRGYVVRKFLAFRVGDGFPRLLEDDLPNGVGDVSYAISLALATPFQVEQGAPGWWRQA
jgi:hypothetical protein